jgi:ubiquinone/menaquinone biosynthesis C-methylase UbiE
MNKIKRLNRQASLPKNQPNKIIDKLQLIEGDRILEIGVGGGFFAEKFSTKIGKSGVYFGVDTEDAFLKNLKTINPELANIKTVKSLTGSIPKIDEKLDLIFTRNVFHHLLNRTEYFKATSNLLTPNGRVCIIDYNERAVLMKLTGHYTPKKVIIKELNEAGLVLENDYDFLNKQSFLIFKQSSDKN